MRDAGTACAQWFQFGENRVLQGTQRGEEAVADGVLHQVAELFDRVELRAVGRQRYQAHIGRSSRVGGLQVKPGLVLDDDVPGGGIGLADLAQERRVNVLVYGRGEEQFHPVGAVDFDRLM